MSHYVTAIGLDVHARSIKAFALNPMSGECERASFATTRQRSPSGHSASRSPGRSTRSGVTGFHLCRTLRALGLDCVVGAVSKDAAACRGPRQGRPTDATPSSWPACSPLVTSWRSGYPTRAPRPPATFRVPLPTPRDDLQRAKQRMSKFLLRHGHVFDETTPTGARKGNWTRAYWRWADAIEFAEADDAAAYEHYRDCVRRCQEARDALARRVAESAGRPGWKPAVDALRCVKGVDVATAFLLACEAGDFSRFRTAPEFASWCGLTPIGALERRDVVEGRDHARGQRPRALGARRGGWHVPMSSREAKPLASDQEVAPAVRRHAAKCNRRLQDRREAMSAAGKKPVVANCATAREMACWVWANSEDGRGVAPRRERQVPTRGTAAVRGRWEATRVFFYGQRGTATPANRLRSRPPAVANEMRSRGGHARILECQTCVEQTRPQVAPVPGEDR